MVRGHEELMRRAMVFDSCPAVLWCVWSRLCSSYPELLLVPAWVTDKELENVAAFRSWKRFPVVVYRCVCVCVRVCVL